MTSNYPDLFIKRNGLEYAGTHLIVDFWGAVHLDDLELMQTTMREAVQIAGASLLHIHLHHFSSSGGITGVAVLAESHISVHTWPERGFAAFDIFMCGNAEPEKAVTVFKAAFNPTSFDIKEHLRGIANRDVADRDTADQDVVDRGVAIRSFSGEGIGNDGQ